MNGKLAVAIIWHMHQPYYKHPQTSEFVLPWVRLHASKDYLHMARLLNEFPKVKVNFTMVPSLRDQLEDYARGADDEDTRVTMRTVEGTLTPEERDHMLARFFSIHHGNVIALHDEYRRLLQLALAARGRPELLSDDYFVDLALWFNLAWIDPDDIAGDERLRDLRDRARRFTREDVHYVIGRQRFMASGAPHLYRSLERDDIGALVHPEQLYQPFRLTNGVTALFRDREISDRIGFAYGSMSPHDAVGDLIWKLEAARDRLPDDGGPYIASIILDGENAWEAYPNNGNDFLRTLYGTLEADERFETVRVSDFLDAHPAKVKLPALHTGSWIDGDLRVWSGEPAHQRAWHMLERTRRFAQEQWGSLREMPPSVRQPLMVAEGSDWFWWYSSRNSSPEDRVFDELFRANCEVIWWYAGAEPPDELKQPLLDPARLDGAMREGGAMLPGKREGYG